MVGDFPLYDSLIAGNVSTLLNHGVVIPNQIPELDSATKSLVAEIQAKNNRSIPETEFLAYVNSLEELRQIILEITARK